MSSVEEKVLTFYKELPFNIYSEPEKQIHDVMDCNQVEAYYADLHNLFKTGKVKSFLDVGCGGGWLALSVERYYGIERILGIDFNPDVIKVACEVAARMESRARFRQENLFLLDPARHEQFDVVCSLGVLHHTPNTFDAIKAVSRMLSDSPDARLYIGLYHLYGRKPFLKCFEKMKKQGKSELEMYEAFREMHSELDDEVHLKSWFRDQVLHPHECQHTLKEMMEFMDQLGFEVVSTSINKYGTMISHEGFFELEKSYEQVSYQRNFIEKRYFPGFFTFCAKRA